MTPRPGDPGRRGSRKPRGSGRRVGSAPTREEHVTDFGDPRVARRFKHRALAVMSVAAAAGVTWYALAPGVASYQIGYTLALPALITAIVWIGRRLPRWLDWVIAVALAAGGSVAYLLVDGSEWWLGAQVAALPLVVLVVTPTRPPSTDHATPWYGGMQDGPWGPP